MKIVRVVGWGALAQAAAADLRTEATTTTRPGDAVAVVAKRLCPSRNDMTRTKARGLSLELRLSH